MIRNTQELNCIQMPPAIAYSDPLDHALLQQPALTMFWFFKYPKTVQNDPIFAPIQFL
jgi:hypothetical protein